MLTWTIWKCLQDPSYLWICSKFTSRCQSMLWYDQWSVAWGKAFIDFLKIPPSDAKKQLSEERLFSSFKDLQFALSKIVTKASILSNVCSFIRFCLSLPLCCFYPAAPLSPPKTWSAELFPSSFVGEEILIIRIMRAVYRAISYWQIKRYFKKKKNYGYQIAVTHLHHCCSAATMLRLGWAGYDGSLLFLLCKGCHLLSVDSFLAETDA